MKIGIAQLNSVNSVLKNYQQIESLIHQACSVAVEEKPEIIFFPENALYFRIDENIPIEAPDLDHKCWNDLQALAQKYCVELVLTTAIRCNGQVTNATVLVSAASKNIQILYSKIHLFDIHLSGQKPIRESDVFTEGKRPEIFEFKGIKFGLSICYDIRFSELYHYYAKQEVDAIVIPAAFLVKTGQAHWHILNRARAIESQCYVISPAQAGTHQSVCSEQKRETFGHSLGIDPWGRVVCEIQQGLGIAVMDLDVQQNIQVRQQIPMKNHRRL